MSETAEIVKLRRMLKSMLESYHILINESPFKDNPIAVGVVKGSSIGIAKEVEDYFENYFMDKMVDEMLAVIEAVCKKHPVVRASITAGTMLCPICKKSQLSYTISSHNGHIHATCSDESCVRFIQ